MILRALFVASLLVSLLFSQVTPAYVFSPDDRKPLTGEKKLAYQDRVGLVFGPNGAAGTGFVFMRPNLVLTASHVLFDGKGNLRAPLKKIKFFFGVNLKDARENSRYRIVNFSAGTRATIPEKWKDWVVLLLEKDVPNTKPFQPLLESDLPIVQRTNLRIEMIGFHHDLDDLILYSTHGVVLGPLGKNEPPGSMFRHSCDSHQRSSGSPLISQNKAGSEVVLGLHIGDMSRRNGDGTPIEYGSGEDGSLNQAIYISDEIIDSALSLLEK